MNSLPDGEPGGRRPVRFVHLSDLHITVRPLGWKRRDWLSKRVAGWINLNYLGRHYRFRHAVNVLDVLMAELRRDAPDHLIFSGDASTMGFDREFARAAELLGVNGPNPVPGIAVPGNHDHYLHHVAAAGGFERQFHPWQHGVRIDDQRYPFAQRVGHVWLVGVNSALGSSWAWDATGRVGKHQLDRLDRLLQVLDPGPRVLVTHYPFCVPGGKPEPLAHRLLDRHALMEIAVRGGVCLWLHGHRHDPYHVDDPRSVPIPTVCAGSATQTGYWTYAEYTVTGDRVRIVRKTYSPEDNRFIPGEALDVSLSPAAGNVTVACPGGS